MKRHAPPGLPWGCPYPLDLQEPYHKVEALLKSNVFAVQDGDPIHDDLYEESGFR
jgi:hypothetical protein